MHVIIIVYNMKFEIHQICMNDLGIPADNTYVFELIEFVTHCKRAQNIRTIFIFVFYTVWSSLRKESSKLCATANLSLLQII